MAKLFGNDKGLTFNTPPVDPDAPPSPAPTIDPASVLKGGKYGSMMQKYRDSGANASLNWIIWKFEHEHQTIVGRLKDIQEFTGGKFDKACKQYFLETDHGNISTILGTYMDKQLEGKVRVGQIIGIEFIGQVELDDGRHVNRFNVFDLSSVANG